MRDSQHSRLAIVIAAVSILASCLTYTLFFANTPISDNPERWGQLGDYLGGTLNPILSFISILLLTRSLNIQSETQLATNTQFTEERKREIIRSFESRFLGLIASLGSSDGIKICHKDNYGEIFTRHGKDAVKFLELLIEEMRDSSASDSQISDQLSSVDIDDDIYETCRRFYVCAKLINNHLHDCGGFTQQDRIDQFVTMINFTSIHNISVICMSIQYSDLPSIRYILGSSEFLAAAEITGMPIKTK